MNFAGQEHTLEKHPLDNRQLKKIRIPVRRPMLAKVIYNPASGRPDPGRTLLVTILHHMQSWEIRPEVYIVHPQSNLTAVVRDAIRRGFRLIVVCGGDGTVDSVAGALVDTPATLGIIPTGMRNNVAISLDIPIDDVQAAVAILRSGRRLRIDAGYAQCGTISRWFLETCTVGLISAIFPAADDIQHGNLVRIGDLLAALVTTPPSKIKIRIDEQIEMIEAPAHIVLAANMPYFGAHFQVAPDISFSDGVLDVFTYSNLTKLDLIGYTLQMTGGIPEDPRIHHYRAHQVWIESDPAMLIMADGFKLGTGAVTLRSRARALTVMTGAAALASQVSSRIAASGEVHHGR